MQRESTGTVDLAALKLTAGEARRLQVPVAIADVTFGDERYAIEPAPVPVSVSVSRMIGGGWALKADFTARLVGRCMRCLGPAAPEFTVSAREVDAPEEDPPAPELESPYVTEDERLDVASWARDALVLELPGQMLCREDCRGLCPVCGADLNADPEHAHESAPDPRWAKLADLRFDE